MSNKENNKERGFIHYKLRKICADITISTCMSYRLDVLDTSVHEYLLVSTTRGCTKATYK